MNKYYLWHTSSEQPDAIIIAASADDMLQIAQVAKQKWNAWSKSEDDQ